MEHEQRPLLVIADLQSITLWRAIGAQGIVFSKESLRETIRHIQNNADLYRAALVGENVYSDGHPIVKALNDNDIPWIVLLDTTHDEKIGYQELERLSEKAIGMKLSFH